MKLLTSIKFLLTYFVFCLFLTSTLYAEPENNIPDLPKYKIHYISKGENLHALAAYYLGNPRKWQKIYHLNKQVIKDPNFLKPGVKISIPVAEIWSSRYTIKEFMEKIYKKPDKFIFDDP